MSEESADHSESRHEVIHDPELERELAESSGHRTDKRDEVYDWAKDEGVFPTRADNQLLDEQEIEEGEHAWYDDRLEEVINKILNDGELGGYDQTMRARSMLASGWYSVDTANRLVEIIRNHYINSQNEEYFHAMNNIALIEHMPGEMLAELYDLPADESRDNLKQFIRTIKSSEEESQGEATDEDELCLRILNKLYIAKGKKDQKSRGLASDPLAVEVMNKFQGAELPIALLPQNPTELESKEVFSRHNNEVRRYAVAAMFAMGLPEEMIVQQMASMSKRHAMLITNGPESHSVFDSSSVQFELRYIHQAVSYAGTEVIKQLHEKFGVEMLLQYNPLQLDQLKGLLDKDQKTIDYLKNGDVTVMFSDTRGDHNGATMGSVLAYKKASERTLLFEVREAGDIYRRMAYLKSLGILPSTFVYASHGDPGTTGYGGKLGGFYAGDSLAMKARYSEYARPEQVHVKHTQFGRLVRDYMQPNRGIDSSAEDIGRKQVILHTCSGDDWRTNELLGVDESLAEATVKTLKPRDPVDVYAADGVMYTHMSASRVGFDAEDEVTGRLVPSMYRLRRGRRPLFAREPQVQRDVVLHVNVDKEHSYES